MSRDVCRTNKVLRLSVATIVVAGLLSVGAPSRAGVGEPCPPKRVCLYDGAFDGLFKTIRGKARVINLKNDERDQTSSVMNNRSRAVILYRDQNAKGPSSCVEPDSFEVYVGEEFDNTASSVKLSKRTDCPA